MTAHHPQFNFRCPAKLSDRIKKRAKEEGYGGRSNPLFSFIEKIFDFYVEYAEDGAVEQESPELEEVAEDAVEESVADDSIGTRIEELLDRFDKPTKEDPFIRSLARVSATVFRNMKRKGEL